VRSVAVVFMMVASTAAAQSPWEVTFEVPRRDRAALFSIAAIGQQVFVGGVGFIARSDGHGWTVDRVEPVAIYSFHGDRDGDVLAIGSSATLLRFDGSRWNVEHQDRRVGERAGHDPELRRCGNDTLVVLRDFALRRDASAWSRVALRGVCDPPASDRPGSACAEPFRDHRWNECGQLTEVWSETDRAWSVWPHRRRGRHPWRHYERGARWYVTTELPGVAFRREGTEWVRETLPREEMIMGIAGNERFVYVIADGVVMRRAL
jgi:hypothetical protein